MTRHFVLGLLWLAMGCQSQPNVDTCGLDHQTIASWLNVARLGERPADPEAAKRWDHENDDSLPMILDEPPFTAWCAGKASTVDTACWTHAGDARPDCRAAREQVLELPVSGPLCELDGRYLASVWLAAEAGLVPDLLHVEAYDRYASAVYASYKRLARVPIALICKQTGGYPLSCYVDNKAAGCHLLARMIAFWTTTR
ncbi:MAG: hypothetical protein JWQ07_5700 [Ramlibacter sp.]|nr:hypothetical protein [Ramlibacter sp.]